MKKVIKIIVGIVVVLLILLIGLVATLPMTIGPLVKKGAAVGGPKALGVNVSIGDVKLKPIMGELIISELNIGNPEGYSDKDSFAVKTVDIDLDTKSLVKGDTIYIEKIMIDAPAILFETKDGKSNFDAMLEKAQSNEKDVKDSGGKDESGKPKKKVVIKEFILKDSKVAYSSGLTLGKAITVPLPTVTVNNIGESSGGVSMAEALSEVVSKIVGGLKDAVTGAVSGAGDMASDALKGSGDAAKEAAESTEEALKDAGEATGQAVKDAAGKLKGLFGK